MACIAAPRSAALQSNCVERLVFSASFVYSVSLHRSTITIQCNKLAIEEAHDIPHLGVDRSHENGPIIAAEWGHLRDHSRSPTLAPRREDERTPWWSPRKPDGSQDSPRLLLLYASDIVRRDPAA